MEPDPELLVEAVTPLGMRGRKAGRRSGFLITAYPTDAIQVRDVTARISRFMYSGVFLQVESPPAVVMSADRPDPSKWDETWLKRRT